MNSIHLVQFIFLSLAVSAISYTISKTLIFKFLRKFIFKHSNWAGELVSCPYCLSHWFSFVLIYYYFRFISLEIIILNFAIIAMSAIWIGMIARSFDFMTGDE